MYPILSEIFFSCCMINSTIRRRRTHLVQSFSVAFLYWLYYSILFTSVVCLGPATLTNSPSFLVNYSTLSLNMASRSGTSSGSSMLLQNSGSEEDLQVLMDQRKRKRMISNRESARRSRMKKQKHLDQLAAQLAQLNNDNNHLLTTLNLTTQRYLTIQAQNSVLTAQVAELTHRLQSFNQIIAFFNPSNVVFETADYASTTFVDPAPNNFFNPLNMNHQPIMPSAEAMLQY
ncbi:putative transcription factor bZIP family [Lupinus albus]|uniref:Putative transcription factor bZIP family n=1 Tax=Lupinus albus TaxID=3870 RepID=A0A6A4Q7I8_LUPAL|nr:putative transcription factor bZIP family [Lupinus albus]